MTTQELNALADRIEASDGLFTMHGDKPRQLGIRKSAVVIAALRTAATSQAVKRGCMHSTTGPDGHRIVLEFKTLEEMQDARDVVLALIGGR